MYFVGLHGHGTSSSPGPSGAPTECTAGTKSPSGPSRSSTGVPTRVMTRMLTTTYGESVTCTPSCEIGPPSGPIENGTTYMVRPRIEPANTPASSARMTCGSRQWLVGPASSGSTEQMKVRSSTRATSDGSERARKLLGPQLLVEPDEGARVDHVLDERRRLLRGAVDPDDLVRLGERRDRADPRVQRTVPVRTGRSRDGEERVVLDERHDDLRERIQSFHRGPLRPRIPSPQAGNIRVSFDLHNSGVIVAGQRERVEVDPHASTALGLAGRLARLGALDGAVDDLLHREHDLAAAPRGSGRPSTGR